MARYRKMIYATPISALSVWSGLASRMKETSCGRFSHCIASCSDSQVWPVAKCGLQGASILRRTLSRASRDQVGAFEKCAWTGSQKKRLPLYLSFRLWEYFVMKSCPSWHFSRHGISEDIAWSSPLASESNERRCWEGCLLILTPTNQLRHRLNSLKVKMSALYVGKHKRVGIDPRCGSSTRTVRWFRSVQNTVLGGRRRSSLGHLYSPSVGGRRIGAFGCRRRC